MGAAGSTISLQHVSAVDMGKLVAGLGRKYVDYEVIIVDNAISGEVIHEMTDTELKEILESIGIANKAHLTILCNHFKKLKGGNHSPGTDHTQHNHQHNPDCCQFHALPGNFEVGEKVTRTPRVIMNRLFEIQGIAVDPTDLDPAVDKISRAVGGGFGDGKTKYDCFINYRVAADADLAEKLYLYLATKGIHAFLDKKCLKNGEKWKEGFLTGLKNSKCFVALISRKALDKVRDKQADHTWDNVLLEYETALNIMDVTGNKKYICPLHVGECKDGNLAKFIDFNPSLYPDSITALTEAESAATKPAAKVAPPKAPEDGDEPEADDDGEAEDGDNDDIDPITCRNCECELSLHPAGTWGNGWACDWPGHEGPNSFTADDPVYGCPTIMSCNWGVCQTCWNNYQYGQKDDYNQLESIHVDQPEGTKSVYNDAYYCEVSKVQFKESGDDSYLIAIVYYNVRGDMSLGPLQDPSSSRLIAGSKHYRAADIKVYFKDSYQNKGELIYHIPTDEAEIFGSERVAFSFGNSGYSEARLVIPNSSYRECTLPTCSSGTHVMTISDYKGGGYYGGYGCDICSQLKQGFRWFCGHCNSDKCFSCEPIQVFYPECPQGHDMERCTGTKYGGRRCDKCKRSGLQHDPEFYHCCQDGYDLCLSCASEQQAAKQAE